MASRASATPCPMAWACTAATCSVVPRCLQASIICKSVGSGSGGRLHSTFFHSGFTFDTPKDFSSLFLAFSSWTCFSNACLRNQ